MSIGVSNRKKIVLYIHFEVIDESDIGMFFFSHTRKVGRFVCDGKFYPWSLILHKLINDKLHGKGGGTEAIRTFKWCTHQKVVV